MTWAWCGSVFHRCWLGELTQCLLANRDDNVFAVRGIVDEDQQFIGVTKKDMVGDVNRETSIPTLVGRHLMAVDLVGLGGGSFGRGAAYVYCCLVVDRAKVQENSARPPR